MEEIGANAFIEYADFASKMYGTSKKSIRDVAANNKICILDVDEQGVKNMKASDLDCKYVFVQPLFQTILSLTAPSSQPLLQLFDTGWLNKNIFTVQI